MRARYCISIIVLCATLCWLLLADAQVQQQAAPARVFNTAKQKLREGKSIVGATVFFPTRTSIALWQMRDTTICG